MQKQSTTLGPKTDRQLARFITTFREPFWTIVSAAYSILPGLSQELGPNAVRTRCCYLFKNAGSDLSNKSELQKLVTGPDT